LTERRQIMPKEYIKKESSSRERYTKDDYKGDKLREKNRRRRRKTDRHYGTEAQFKRRDNNRHIEKMADKRNTAILGVASALGGTTTGMTALTNTTNGSGSSAILNTDDKGNNTSTDPVDIQS
jgi:hypothetical protein